MLTETPRSGSKSLLSSLSIPLTLEIIIEELMIPRSYLTECKCWTGWPQRLSDKPVSLGGNAYLKLVSSVACNSKKVFIIPETVESLIIMSMEGTILSNL